MFYKAKVVDNIDPENCRRVKVRVLGVHPFLDENEQAGVFYEKVPDDVLPWARPAVPITSGRTSGDRGVFEVPDVDDWVWVFFEDVGMQKPIYFALVVSNLDVNSEFVPGDNFIKKDRWGNEDEDNVRYRRIASEDSQLYLSNEEKKAALTNGNNGIVFKDENTEIHSGSSDRPEKMVYGNKLLDCVQSLVKIFEDALEQFKTNTDFEKHISDKFPENGNEYGTPTAPYAWRFDVVGEVVKVPLGMDIPSIPDFDESLPEQEEGEDKEAYMGRLETYMNDLKAAIDAAQIPAPTFSLAGWDSLQLLAKNTMLSLKIITDGIKALRDELVGLNEDGKNNPKRGYSENYYKNDKLIEEKPDKMVAGDKNYCKSLRRLEENFPQILNGNATFFPGDGGVLGVDDDINETVEENGGLDSASFDDESEINAETLGTETVTSDDNLIVTIIKHTLVEEGGWNGNDVGSCTYRGIRQANNPNWPGWQIIYSWALTHPKDVDPDKHPAAAKIKDKVTWQKLSKKPSENTIEGITKELKSVLPLFPGYTVDKLKGLTQWSKDKSKKSQWICDQNCTIPGGKKMPYKVKGVPYDGSIVEGESKELYDAVIQLYRVEYYTNVGIEPVGKICPGLAAAMFDCGVQCGKGGIEKILNYMYGSKNFKDSMKISDAISFIEKDIAKYSGSNKVIENFSNARIRRFNGKFRNRVKNVLKFALAVQDKFGKN